MVIWLIGLSGAGKSTLAQEVVSHARQDDSRVVFLDGDAVREVFGNDLGYSMEDRRKNAYRFCVLGKMLSDQGVPVVCSILSLFPESRQWNRNNLKHYYEVYIDTPLEHLKQRDVKGLYRRAVKGEIELPGVNMPFAIPDTADLVIHNDQGLEHLLSYAPQLAALLRNDHA